MLLPSQFLCKIISSRRLVNTFLPTRRAQASLYESRGPDQNAFLDSLDLRGGVTDVEARGPSMHATNPHGACTPLAARGSRIRARDATPLRKNEHRGCVRHWPARPPPALARFMVRSWASLCDVRTSLLMDSKSATRGVPRNYLTSGPPRSNLLRWAAAGCPPGLQKRPHPRRSPTPPTSLDQMRCRKVAAVRNCRPCARGPEGQMILFIGPAGPEQSFGRPNFLSAGEKQVRSDSCPSTIEGHIC